ncbi:MAG: hypothetical protein Q9160_000247 [Pyrenula sp. 1 TL-2023]
MVRNAHSDSDIGGETPAVDGSWIDRQITPSIDNAKKSVVDAFVQAKDRWDVEKDVLQGRKRKLGEADERERCIVEKDAMQDRLNRQRDHISRLEKDAGEGKQKRDGLREQVKGLREQVKDLQTKLTESERRQSEFCDVVKTFVGDEASKSENGTRNPSQDPAPSPSRKAVPIAQALRPRIKADTSSPKLPASGSSVPHTITAAAATSGSIMMPPTAAQSTKPKEEARYPTVARAP